MADVLAGESSADDIGADSISSQSVCGECAHVVVAGNGWPVLGEDCATEWFWLAEGDGAHPGALKPEAEAANPAE